MQSESSDTSIDVNVLGALADQLEGFLEGFVRALPNIGVAIVLLIVTWVFARVAKRIIGRALSAARVRNALIELAQTLSSIGIWILGILIVMSVLFPSVKPSSILAALGVGGIAVGFAFKDIFENFLAGVMILLRKPMRLGDFIECEGVEGKIEEILIRDTYVRQNDGQLVLLPNAMLFKNPVYVRTEKELRRYEVIAGVAYDADVDEAREVIRKAVEAVDMVSREKPVDVFAREFNSSSVDFAVRWWTDSEQREMHKSRDQVIASIKRALDEAGIEIPFPYQTLTFKEPLPINSSPGSREGD
ncbi:MAG: mechanosensitive ion channel family protein [Xanthomonadales bacterium]|nr:mechanosensitive ion channel family protein [Xanthomonadales bacterium]